MVEPWRARPAWTGLATRGGAGRARRQPDDRARSAAHRAISDQLPASLPGAEIRIVDVPPVAGAALLGLDHVGAPAAAAARLRECARAT